MNLNRVGNWGRENRAASPLEFSPGRTGDAPALNTNEETSLFSLYMRHKIRKNIHQIL